MKDIEEVNEVQKFFKDMMKNIEMPSPNEEQEQWRRVEQQPPDFLRHFTLLRHISASLYSQFVPAMEVARYLNFAATDLVECIRGLEKITETFLPVIRQIDYWKMKCHT